MLMCVCSFLPASTAAPVLHQPDINWITNSDEPTVSRNMNLTKQMTLILAVFITIAAVTAIVPAYAIIRAELTAQMDHRLQEALHHSQTILEFEQSQIESIITLAAERPTLERLLREQAMDELQAYLEVFRNNTALDQLDVTDLAGNWLAGTNENGESLALSFTAPVADVGFVTGGVLLDMDFAERLQRQTGFRYEFHTAPISISKLHTASNGITYYGGTLALQPLIGDSPATLAVMLPVTGLLAAEGEIIGLLLISTLAVVVSASLGGGLYVRSRIRPLWKLTAAAREMGRGNLSTPIVNPAKTSEIHTLAEVLEQTRIRLQGSLRELSEAKAWSEALIQSVIEGIITFDADEHIVFFSEGAARITHIPPEQAVGQNVNTVLQLAAGESFADFVPPVGGRRSVSIQTIQGEPLTIAITRARQSEAGQTTIVLHDITEETQLRSLQAYFLAHVSHEFRTPLAGMKVSIELLLENARHLSIAEMNELLNSLYLSISSLQNLIDNLLESSKIEASHFSLRRQPVQINQVLSDALRLVQPFLNRRRQTLTLDQPLTLPPLNADTTRLTQVLVNLLSNASKYSPMHSPIDLWIKTHEDALYLAVADRGEGIPPEQRESIFREFVRLGGETSSEYSSGLGLAVVKVIIEAHGGQVGVDTRSGGGSIFWFTLPLREAVTHENPGR